MKPGCQINCVYKYLGFWKKKTSVSSLVSQYRKHKIGAIHCYWMVTSFIVHTTNRLELEIDRIRSFAIENFVTVIKTFLN